MTEEELRSRFDTLRMQGTKTNKKRTEADLKERFDYLQAKGLQQTTQPAQQSTVSQPTQPAQSTQPSVVSSHGAMSNVEHNAIANKQATINQAQQVKESIPKTINEAKTYEDVYRYSVANNIPTTMTLEQAQELDRKNGYIKNNPTLKDSTALPIRNVNEVNYGSDDSLAKAQYTDSSAGRYDKKKGKEEAEEELKNFDINETNSATKIMSYKNNLEKAKEDYNLKDIAKYRTLTDAAASEYVKENKGTKKEVDLKNQENKVAQLSNDLDAYYNQYENTGTSNEAEIEAKNNAAKHFNETRAKYQEELNKYNDMLLYDEYVDTNIGKDIQKSFNKNVLGGTAGIINGGYAAGNYLTDNAVSTINAEDLLGYLTATENTKKHMSAFERAKDPNARANNAFRLLEKAHNSYPDNAKLNRLYEAIKNRTYTGTAEELAKDLDEAQKSIYQDFKDRHTQDDIDAVAAQTAHNERAYKDLAWIPNAFGTVGNQVPSMLLGYATGGLGELLGGGAMATAGTVANTMQQAGSLGSLGLSAGSSAMDQALAEGATYNQALGYGALKGATEAGTEVLGGETINSFFGRAGKGVIGKAFGKAIDGLNIESKIGKAILTNLSDVAGEMTEEMISEAVDPLWRQLTYDDQAIANTDFGEYIGGILKAGIEAIPSTLLMQGGGVAMRVNKINQIENGLIKSINESKELTPIAKEKLISEVRESAENMKLGIDEEVDNASLNAIQQAVDTNQLARMNNAYAQNNDEIAKAYEAFNLQPPTQNAQAQPTAEPLQTSAENMQRNAENTVQNNVQNSVVNAEILNNPNSSVTEKAAELQKQGFKLPEADMGVLDYVQKRLGIGMLFDTNMSGNGNFDPDTRIMKLNPTSPNNVEFTLTHELCHDIELQNAKDYEKLKKLVVDYANSKPGFAEGKNALDETYANYQKEQKAKGIKFDYNIDSESTNDMVARAIGNEDFLVTMGREQPNLFQRFYNWFKNVLFDGDHSGLTFEQRRLINKIKNNFTNAIKKIENQTEYKTEDSGVQYHISENLSNDIDNLLTNGPTTEKTQVRDFSPAALIKNGEKNRVMMMRSSHLLENILTPEEAKRKGYNFKHPHGLGKQLFMEALDQLDNPVAVLQWTDNNSTGKYNSKDYIFLTNLKNLNMEHIIVPIHVASRYDHYDVTIGKTIPDLNNEVKTVYGKKGIYGYITNYARQNDMKILEINKDAMSNGAVQSRTGTNNVSINNNIPPTQHNVKNSLSEGEQSSFSMPENTDKSLVASHNLTEEKLRGVLELGGFPVPSIAISDVNKLTPTQFGDITVLFDKDTIDPANKKNEVYDRDVWSPTFPQVDYEVDKNKIKEISNDIGIREDLLEYYAQSSDSYDEVIRKILDREEALDKYMRDHDLTSELETNSDKRRIARENGIENFLKEKLNGIYGRKGIYNNKEYLTPSGNRRSFWQLHDEYNLGNIVKALTKGRTKGGQNSDFFGGYGRTAAQLAKRFKSIEDIKSDKSRLQKYEDLKVIDELKDKTYNDINELSLIYDMKHNSLNQFFAYDNASKAVEEFARKYQKNLTLDNFKKVLKDYNIDYGLEYEAKGKKYQINDELLNRIIDDLEQMKNIPTDYFEAKPQRAVGFEEIASVLIPNDLAEDTKQQLRDRGINFIEYDPTIEGDREAKYKEAAQDVLFSKSNGKWQQFLDDNFNLMPNAKRNYFESLPSNEELQRAESKGINEILKDLKIPTNEELQEQERKDIAESSEALRLENKISTDRSLTEMRSWKKAGDRKVKAYQYENPEVKPFFQYEAKQLLNDLNNSIRGERYATEDEYGDLIWGGNKRSTVGDITDLLDGNYGTKLSYDDIKKGLEAIINDKGSENIAAAKRIEMVLDKRLREGYTDFEGYNHDPSENYKKFLNGEEYVAPDKYDYDQMVEQYGEPGGEEDNTLFSLSEEEAKEVSNYINEVNEDTSLDENFKNDILSRFDSIKDYKQFQEIKQEVQDYKATEGKKRRWTNTAKRNELVRDNLDINDMYYEPISNKNTLNYARNRIDEIGYDNAFDYIESKVKMNDLFKPTDVAIAESLIQDAIKNKDFEKAQDLIADTAIIGTELGQAVQALSMIARMTPEGQLRYLNKVVNRMNEKIAKKNAKGKKQSQQIKIDSKLAENVLKSQDEVELQKSVDEVLQNIADQMETTLPEKINEWRYLAMLCNPRTHIRNIVANVAMRGTYETKNVIARAIETVASPILEERTRTFKKASADVKKFAEQSTKDNSARLAGDSKKDVADRINELRKVFKNETLERIRKFNSNALSLEDNIFTNSAYKANLEEYLTANGIRTQKDIDLNPDIVQKGIKFATEEAWKTTFHQMSKLANKINELERTNGFSKLIIGGIVPFKKTPINIAKTGAAYSPLGLLETLSVETYNLKNGNITANEWIDRLSQGLTGTAVFAIGAFLAQKGILQGSTDDDEDEYKEAIGQTKSYSVRIGDRNYDISWLSPSAMPLLMGAELVNASKGGKTSFNDIVDSLTKTLDPLSEMSLVSGINSTLKSYSGGPVGMISGAAKNATKSYLGQFVPTIGGQINKIIDDTQRTTTATKNSKWKEGETFLRQQVNKIPGGSFLLEPKTDVWGNEVKRNSNPVVRAFDALINPGTVTEDKTTDTDKELLSLFSETGNKNIIPSIPSDNFQQNNQKYELSSKEYTKFKKDYGQKAYKDITELVKSKHYWVASPDEKSKMVQTIYDEAKKVAKEKYGVFSDVSSIELENKIKKANIPLVDYYVAASKIKGNTSNKAKKNILAGIISSGRTEDSKGNYKRTTDYTKEQKELLYEIFNVK